MGIECPKCNFDNPDDTVYCGKCATPLPSSGEVSVTKTLETPVEGLKRGTTFAERYEIIEKLGTGGMGKVYRVKDEKLDEEMALKVLKPEIAADKGMIERFKNELKLARKIAHRSVCKMYDLNEEEGTHFITMEYVTGEDLKSFIRKKGKISEEDAISLAKQVCEGLSEAHELGVVHRDLKPQNIMIDEKGRAKIMDFGIARSVEAPGVTQTGVMIGTPDYISPEQAEGEEADQRSDIYALGVILYEMVTGSVPFKGDTALSVALKHKAQLPQDPRKLNPEISEDMSRLILVCMEKDRERRYQRAEELLDDLKNIEEGFPLGTKIKRRREIFIAALIRKKLFIPALVVALAIIAVVIWQLLPKAPSITSIAILPFEDLSPLKDQEYFCDGLAEELINRLTNIESLRVPARTSAFSFKAKDLDIQEIGEKLNVEMILDGSVRKAGNKLRITAQLIKVADGYPIWSKIYESKVEDTFALQDEISLAIVDNLKIKLLGEEKAKIVKRYTENLEAYNLYVKGRYFWNKRTEEELKKAIDYFEQALEVDPSYGLAYAGIADAYCMLASYVFLPPNEAFSKTKAASLKALKIDDTLAEAYTSLAFMRYRYEWDWSGAENDFKTAIRLNPNYATAHNWNGSLLRVIGRFDEAFAEFKRAQELDPLSAPINVNLAYSLKFLGKYDQAIEQCKKTIEMYPDFPWAHSILAETYLQKSIFEEAIAEFQKAVALSGRNSEYLSQLGHAYAVAGNREQALKTVKELNGRSKQNCVSRYWIALTYVGLGEKEKAFECLEMAYKERDSNLSNINVEPRFDSLRSDPRYEKLLKKMGLDK